MLEQIMTLVSNNITLEISYCYINRGNETIFCIHGLGCTKESFTELWEDERFHKYSLLTFDLPGFGNSSKSQEYSYTMEDQAQICRLIIGNLNLRNIHVMGHSMGGAIALLLIHKIPHEVLSFFNLEGNLIGEDCKFSRKTINYSQEEFEEIVFNNFRSNIQVTNDLATYHDSSNQLFSEWLSKSNPNAVYRSSNSLVKWSESRKLLKMFINLRLKKMYIFGEQNQDRPIVKLLKSNNIQLIQISNSGHFMMIDNPNEFYQTLYKNITK